MCEGDEAVLGITWYAQDSLGELVLFEGPEVGATLTKDESYAEVESVKAVSDVVAPLSGEVLEVNQKAVDEPETMNEDPYGERLARPDQGLGRGRGRPADGRRGVQGAYRRAVTTGETARLCDPCDRTAGAFGNVPPPQLGDRAARFRFCGSGFAEQR